MAFKRFIKGIFVISLFIVAILALSITTYADDDDEKPKVVVARTKSDLDRINRDELTKIEQLENNELGKPPVRDEKKQLSKFLDASMYSPMLAKFLSDGN